MSSTQVKKQQNPKLWAKAKERGMGKDLDMGESLRKLE